MTLPAPGEHPLRTVLRFAREPFTAPGEHFDRLGDTFRLEAFGRTAVFTRSPEWFDAVLVQSARSFRKDALTRGLSEVLGHGLLTTDGEVWRARRRVLAAEFAPLRVADHLALFEEETERALAKLAGSEPLDLGAAMAELTLRVAIRAFFHGSSELEQHLAREMDAVMTYFEGVLGTQVPLPLWIPSPANRRFLHARRRLHRFLDRLLAEPAFQASPLGVLRRDHPELSDTDLRAEAMTLLVAGHETSALGLTYLLAELAKLPQEQSAIVREVEAWSTPASLADVTGKSSLGRALLEGMRLYPVTWALGREALEDVVVQGEALARGTQVYLYQWAALRSGRHFTEPERFWPERFVRQPLSSLPKGLYAPFGAGPRVCIGNHFALAEMAVVLGRTLARYELEPYGEFPGGFRASITARPAAPVRVRLRRRASGARAG